MFVGLYVWVKKGVLLGEMSTDISMFDGSVKTEQVIKYNDSLHVFVHFLIDIVFDLSNIQIY